MSVSQLILMMEKSFLQNFQQLEEKKKHMDYKSLKSSQVLENGYMIGQSCIGAWSQIRPLDKELKNASFLWNGKCEVPDKTLNRVKKYKKPQ